MSRNLRDGALAAPLRPRDLAARFEEELLTDWYDDWVTVWRERWRQARLHALESMARGLARVGEFDAAVECALAAIVAEPLRESSHRVLIEVHLLEGNRSEALREYDALKGLLARELGLEPDRELTDLIGPLSAARDHLPGVLEHDLTTTLTVH
jgi:DNA-binding SARP family transcriptional activator